MNPKRVLALIVPALLCAAPASAQSSRLYAAGTIGRESGSRGPVDVGTLSTVGGVLGVRIGGGWSLELHADTGMGSKMRTYEGVRWSAAPAGASFDEVQRLSVHALELREDRARQGFSALAVWKSRHRGRLNVALSGGVSRRWFDARTSVTVTRRPEGISPADPRFQDFDVTSSIAGNGLTAGIITPIRITGAVSVAPEVRLTLGLITDESEYKALNTGLRVMWGF